MFKLLHRYKMKIPERYRGISLLTQTFINHQFLTWQNKYINNLNQWTTLKIVLCKLLIS